MDEYISYTDKKLFELLAATENEVQIAKLLGEIMKRYEGALFFKIRSIIPEDERLVEEALYDVFATLWKKRQQLAIVKKPRAWLLTVARNKAVDAIRREKGHAKYLNRAIKNYLEIPENHPAFDEKDYARREERIRQAIEKLPLQRRTVFAMKKLDEMSVSGIARIMGLDEQTVKNHVYAAKMDLQGMLDKYRREGWK